MGYEISPKDALAVNLWVLRLTGAWIEDVKNRRLRVLYDLYGAVILCFFVIAFYLTEVIYVTLKRGDLEAIREILLLFLTHVANGVKLANLLLRRKRVEKLVGDTCQSIFIPRNIHHRDYLAKAIKDAHRDNVLFCMMCTSTIVAWAIVPLIGASENRYLPLKAWYPFDTSSSPIFGLIYVYQLVAVEINACTNAMMDTFASVLMAIAGVQLDMLRQDISDLNDEDSGMMSETGNGAGENIERKSMVVENKVEENKVKGKVLLGFGAKEFPGLKKADILHGRIVGCIEHHAAIIRFAKEIQDVFGIGILSQFAVSSIILCLTCIELTLTSPSNLQFYSMLLYQGCMLFQIYCYCWHGNGIIVKTSELMTTAFHCQWTSCSPSFKSTLRIMMCRMQRPMKLMVGGLFSLSLETLSMILRSAYSFYAVIQSRSERGYSD